MTELDKRRLERERRLDDVFVKVACNALGTRASRAVRVGMEAREAGATYDEAEQSAVRWLHAHPDTDL